MSFRHDERGQAAALTVICLTVMMVLSALVLDVGSWYQAQRETQAAADAAALAAAQALPESSGEASVLAANYVAKNGGGAADVTFTTKNAANDTVSVRVGRSAPGFFAQVFGVDSVDIGAKATARASGLAEAKWVAPIVVNIKHPKLNCGSSGGKPVPCFGDATQLDLAHLHQPGSGDAAGAFGLINLDRSDSGSVGGSTLGDWISQGFDQYMPLGDYTSVPSAKFNDSHVKNALDFRMGDVLLFPIYKTLKGSGSNAVYDIVGWVGFRVTSFQANGSTGKVRGSFTKVIWEGIGSQSGAGMNYGALAIELVE
jgi:Flp pilus assembly protein TadG